MASTAVAIGLLKCYGRRTLFIFGQFTMAISLGLLGMFDVLGQTAIEQVFVLAFVCFFEFSQGPICWLYNAEIMPLKGVTIATLVNWACTLIISFATPAMIDTLGISGTFFIFAGCCAVGLIFMIAFVPETKGKTPAQIKNMFSSIKHRRTGKNINYNHSTD